MFCAPDLPISRPRDETWRKLPSQRYISEACSETQQAVGGAIHPIIDIFEDRHLGLSAGFPFLTPGPFCLEGFEKVMRIRKQSGGCFPDVKPWNCHSNCLCHQQRLGRRADGRERQDQYGRERRVARQSDDRTVLANFEIRMRLLHAFERGSEAKTDLRKWLAYYNAERPHSTHAILPPDEACASKTEPMRLAA